jgi:uncharacterized protein YceH (UPF0502 family)
VVSYDEDTVREAAQRLSRYGLARLASGHSSRAAKYRHLAEEALGLSPEQLAVLCVLLLRGPQTPGELKARTERMVGFARLDDVERVLQDLGEKGHARRLPRRPGQKEDRFEQLLGGGSGGGEDEQPAPGQPPPGISMPAPIAAPAGGRLPSPPAAEHPASSDAIVARIEALESGLAALRDEVRALRAELGA